MSNYALRCNQSALFYAGEKRNERSPWMSTHIFKETEEGAMKFVSRDEAYKHATAIGLWAYSIVSVGQQLDQQLEMKL
jgi:hypothetical protein